MLQSSRITHKRVSLFCHGRYQRAPGKLLFPSAEAANPAGQHEEIPVASADGEAFWKTQASVRFLMCEVDQFNSKKMKT